MAEKKGKMEITRIIYCSQTACQSNSAGQCGAKTIQLSGAGWDDVFICYNFKKKHPYGTMCLFAITSKKNILIGRRPER